MKAGDKLPGLAQVLNDFLAHAGHDSHVDGDVWGVGNLDSVLSNWGSNR
eukprot:CAMPEP_0196659902 /NCGR_PEP_ID=MMETSP1086-20130531/37073_1 /TAXON_ID=77921 /ORGANISM="Cyanoptyche  gloeocystis , Strain SAG4.97" /LENGTH=48 /DNA_ID= /DNA_START= /DNA_END= /DNA_ORIENTATION=